jgi:hypothetical protein
MNFAKRRLLAISILSSCAGNQLTPYHSMVIDLVNKTQYRGGPFKGHEDAAGPSRPLQSLNSIATMPLRMPDDRA